MSKNKSKEKKSMDNYRAEVAKEIGAELDDPRLNQNRQNQICTNGQMPKKFAGSPIDEVDN